MRQLLIFLFCTVGCFQAIPFPGQQADVDIEPVNNIDGEAIDEGIFDEFIVQQVDQNGDGVVDFAISAFMSLNANFDVETLCDEASNAGSIDDLLNTFDDALFAGTLSLVVSDPNTAVGLNNGDNIQGDPDNGQVFVVSFFLVTEGGDIVVFANSDFEGELDIETINNELNGSFTDQLTLDFANDPNGDNINSDINAFLFNATECDIDDLLEDTLINTFNLNL
jgi:hypothetical protein